MLPKRSHTFLLSLIPDLHLRILPSRVQMGVIHGGTQGRTDSLVSSERSNFSALLDVPGPCLSALCADKELVNLIVEDQSARG